MFYLGLMEADGRVILPVILTNVVPHVRTHM